MERTADLAESFLKATEAAAIAAADWRGRGKRKIADGAAVEAMRAVFDSVPFDGRVAIGEVPWFHAAQPPSPSGRNDVAATAHSCRGARTRDVSSGH